MKRKLIFFLCLSLLLPTILSAAKRKKVVKPKVPVVVEDPKFTAMLASTARITILDSTVIDSIHFMDPIHVNTEEGRVVAYRDFFGKEGNGMVYVNELGNMCIYSKYDSEHRCNYLFQSDLLADGWTIGRPLEGIDNEGRLRDFDYPYLMPDGVTLYFSAKGDEGLGGFDIYRTRLDTDGNKYLKPENLGLPYNSDADDYAYIVDEQNQLAYFASNRRQPAGKTCVYGFVPVEVRQMLNNVSEETIRSLARIDRIRDTWTNKEELAQGRQRKQRVTATNTTHTVPEQMATFDFVVNDHTTYHSFSDFKTAANKNRMIQFITLRNQVETLTTALEKARNYYIHARSNERAQLKADILQSEQQLEKLYAEMREMEKTIRNTENQ